jgi:predicted Rossmann fold nucleotide-binding protein DprA/Smf involved in DNA uptake
MFGRRILETTMKVIIAGGRDVLGSAADDLVREAISKSGWTNQITNIIHGAAPGIDSAAHRVCEGLWPVKPVPANWRDHGRSAGPIRNRTMAAMADALIAVWDGKSRGTKNMIETAENMGLKVYVHRYE